MSGHPDGLEASRIPPIGPLARARYPFYPRRPATVPAELKKAGLSSPPMPWHYRFMDKDKTIRRYRVASIFLFAFLAFFVLTEITLPAVADCAGVDSVPCTLAGLWTVFTDVFYPVVLVFSAGVAVWILKTTTFSRDLPE